MVDCNGNYIRIGISIIKNEKWHNVILIIIIILFLKKKNYSSAKNGWTVTCSNKKYFATIFSVINFQFLVK